MCGIAGIFGLDGRRIPEGALSRMNAVMIHRGPDEDGSFCDDVAGLAMRRLSIIGLGNGRQPIFNETSDVAIVMNGEIYNYLELRARLERAGHVFKTNSDVEVAVHLYEERGSEFVDDLRGMFAFALYDRRRRRLLLGRDRAGKKPLYYAAHGHLLLFGSEIKALYAAGVLSKEIDVHALESYLAHGFVVGDRTLFAGVRKLPAGCLLTATTKGIEVQQYWNLPMPGNGTAESGKQIPTFTEAAVRVRELLEEAVRIRLMSEVPLGAFLSGGVDSSAVVGIMSRQLDRPVETFAVGFDHREFDELRFARAAARLYGTHHHEVIIRDCSPALLQEINWHHDEPAADPATVPTFCLAKFARQHVTVALTGEGGDELFGGYRHYRFGGRIAAIEDRVAGVRSVANMLTRLEPYAGNIGPWRLWKAIWIAHLPSAQRLRGLISAFTDAEVDRILAPGFRAANPNGYHAATFQRLLEGVRDADAVAQLMYADTKSQLADQLLMKVDKMTMAASLEARCPFLDQRLMEYVAVLPTEMKISQAGSKIVLRQALQGLVPEELLSRPKHGFDVPVRRWLLQDLAPVAARLLLEDGAPVGRYLNLPAVRSLWSRLQSRGDLRIARQAWILLNFAVWHEQHWPQHATVSAPAGASRSGTTVCHTQVGQRA